MNTNDHDTRRKLPSVDKVLHSEPFTRLILEYDREVVTSVLRDTLGALRKNPNIEEQVDIPVLAKKVTMAIRKLLEPSLREVINATGVVLHTNLGRAPLGESILQEITPIIRGYCNIEFDLSTAKRGHRTDHIRELLKYLCGAEDVVIVNNNAAAIILILHTLANNKQVIISRGELIEIGGAFRIPEIMASSGAVMVEVGTTNRTRICDYENAITPETAIIFKAHKSNFSIHGFTEEASLRELSTLAKKYNIPFVYDIGSGLLHKPSRINLETEPDVKTSLADGVDLVTFSGDKLLGGPQAGIIAGRGDLIAKLSKAPLMRALRVGKLTLATLAAACRQYITNEKLLRTNPLFQLLDRNDEELLSLSQRFLSLLEARGINASATVSMAQVGGGTLPDVHLKSYAVVIHGSDTNVKSREKFSETLYFKLLELQRPVLGVLREGNILFDIFTIRESDLEYCAEAIASVLSQN